MSSLAQLLHKLFKADDDAQKAPAHPPSQTAAPCPLQDKTEPYIVDVKVCTRLNDIPMKGVPVLLDDASMGNTDTDGKVPESARRTKTSFVVKVVYENPGQHLKREEVGIKVTGIAVPGGSFSAQQINFIDKIRDVAGTLDDRSFSDSFTPSDLEVKYEKRGSDHVFHVLVHLATLSLNVPYFNQRSSTDAVTTSDSDPEGPDNTHELGPLNGDVLCFPSSMTMLMRYWGREVSRREVLQTCYDFWASEGFDQRADANATVSATAPANPKMGDLWLQKKDPPSAACGYKMFRYRNVPTWTEVPDETGDPDTTGKKPPKNPDPGDLWLDTSQHPPELKQFSLVPGWQQVGDTEWRPQKDGINFWEYFYEERETAKRLKPAGTSVKEWVAGGTLNGLSSALKLQGAPDSFAGKLSACLAKGQPAVFSTTATSGHVMIVRGVVADHGNNIVRLIINDPYGTLESPKSNYHTPQIQASVGKDGDNNRNDVEQMQAALNAIGYYTGEIDGNCSGEEGDVTVRAIEAFEKKKMNRTHPEKVMDPGGKIEKELRAAAEAQAHNYRVKGERNDGATEGESATRGLHVYYDDSTHGHNGPISIKAKDRGCVMLAPDTPFSKPELTGRLTPHG